MPCRLGHLFEETGLLVGFWCRFEKGNCNAIANIRDRTSSELKLPSSELELPSSELELPSSELELPSSELERSSYEQQYCTS
jgi:hypothetical protein